MTKQIVVRRAPDWGDETGAGTAEVTAYLMGVLLLTFVGFAWFQGRANSEVNDAVSMAVSQTYPGATITNIPPKPGFLEWGTVTLTPGTITGDVEVTTSSGVRTLCTVTVGDTTSNVTLACLPPLTETP